MYAPDGGPRGAPGRGGARGPGPTVGANIGGNPPGGGCPPHICPISIFKKDRGYPPQGVVPHILKKHSVGYPTLLLLPISRGDGRAFPFVLGPPHKKDRSN